MRRSRLALPHAPAAAGILALLASLPMACAEGTLWTGPPGSGTGAGGAATTTAVGGLGGANATTGGFPSAATSSSGGPSSACDQGSCLECQECAQCQTCADQTGACEASFACSDILCCATNCDVNDTACVEDCISEDPAGEADFTAYSDCLACSCVTTCAFPTSSSCP